MKLYFDKNKVSEIIAATENGSGHHVPYTGNGWGRPEDTSPGLLIVGDQGVYIIGNEDTKEAPLTSGLIAYATGCDPRIDKNWWPLKQATFGLDDGAEFLSLDDAKRLLLLGERSFLEFTDEEVIWGSE